MWRLPLNLLLKVGLVALILAAAWAHLYGDNKTRTKLAEVTVRAQLAEAQLLQVTTSLQDFQSRLESSEEQRLKIQSGLKVTLDKLRNQVPPKTCEAAIRWSVENKGDLAW